MELDDIIYAAITGDSSLVSLTDGNIVTCCFEVPPDIEDNTPLPYIIIVEDPTQNDQLGLHIADGAGGVEPVGSVEVFALLH